MKYTIISILLFIQIAGKSNTYFIDAKDGNDSNKGLTTDSAWKSYKNFNKNQFFPGDSILFKRGSFFNNPLSLQLEGEKENTIYVGTYGSENQPKPIINGGGKEKYGLLLKNSSYCTISDLEITNTGISREAYRFGVYVLLDNYGESKDIKIQRLTVRDVNGSLVKADGAGGGIFWENKGGEVKSRFNGLHISHCKISNCGRNGIYSAGYAGRDNWYPSLKVIIEHNLIEGVPGDGIVPIGCDGAIIQYNVMRNCPDVLSPDEAAAGIWPWSCDNTLIQYNEVSDHNAKWDGQGFDSDYNCNNTIIQYNYSHDNAGGFILVCNDGYSLGKNWNKGTTNTLVQFNISVNDGIRKYPTKQAGWFNPVIHITGPVEKTTFKNNLIIQVPKEAEFEDYRFIKMGDWGNKWPDKTIFDSNIWIAEDGVSGLIELGEDRNTTFQNNYWLGDFESMVVEKDTSGVKLDKGAIMSVFKHEYIFDKIKALKLIYE